MSIENKIGINSHYTRSVNLNRDVDSDAVTKSYIPTSRALKTLDHIAESLNQDEAPRAWSLVGPYGSGKSTFAVFVANLLGDPESTSTKVAATVINKAAPAAATHYEQLTKDNSGYCTVLLTGSPVSLIKSLMVALNDSVQEVWAERAGRNPAVINRLKKDVSAEVTYTIPELIKTIKEVQDALAKIEYAGLFIVIDELGKFLEYEARHFGANEIYLLQELAELAYTKHDAKLAMAVMLHQSIDQYARGLGESLKNEWAKVQGRFESVPFLESTEQVLRIVEAAIEQDLSESEQKKVHASAHKIAKQLSKEKALSGSMDVTTAGDLFANCYPLHPISTLLLPILCQKVAQNERTLFSYLGSRESHGFLDSLKECSKVGEWIYPWEIYEYFIRNQPASISDHYTHRRWAEVVTALERLGDSEGEVEKLLKTVGLLNIVGSQGGLKASTSVLKQCIANKKVFEPALKELTVRSIVQYRKFNSEYRVWQGSDFDLEGRVDEERSKIGYFSLAEKINSRHNTLPMVARKYTIDNGALRYFVPIFADRDEYKKIDIDARHPRVIFFLSESKEDERLFAEEVMLRFSGHDLLVLCPNGEQIREAVGEVLALDQVGHTSPELTSDPVAQREYNDSYADASTQEELLINSVVEAPQLSQWYWRSQLLSASTKRSLQEILSMVLRDTYRDAPLIKNELINRDKTSSTANAARNRLIKALLNNRDKADLGIDKFPAEKSVYRAFLRATGLHFERSKGKWALARLEDLDVNNDPYNMVPVWSRLDQFLSSTEQEPKSLIELNKEFFAPPYGVKEGVLPLLYVVLILAYQEELAITEDNVYVPYITSDHLDRFLKRPDKFKLQRVQLDGVNREIIDEYSKALFADGAQRSMLDIAKPIAQFIDGLPQYTKQTSGALSAPAKAVRDSFKLSKSPIKLLLEELPKALGVELENVSELSNLLTDALRELKYAYAKMTDEMVALIAQSLDIDRSSSLQDVRKALVSRSYGLENYTVDEQGLRGFIVRAHRDQLDDDVWLDNLLMFLGGRPPAKWKDENRVAAEYKLGTLVQKMRDLVKLRMSYEDNKQEGGDGTDVYLLKSIKSGGLDQDAVVVVDAHLKKAAQATKKQVMDILNSDGVDGKIGMAVLAEIVDEFLREDGSQELSEVGESNSLTAIGGNSSEVA